jgi:hypothetical protein
MWFVVVCEVGYLEAGGWYVRGRGSESSRRKCVKFGRCTGIKAEGRGEGRRVGGRVVVLVSEELCTGR